MIPHAFLWLLLSVASLKKGSFLSILRGDLVHRNLFWALRGP